MENILEKRIIDEKKKKITTPKNNLKIENKLDNIFKELHFNKSKIKTLETHISSIANRIENYGKEKKQLEEVYEEKNSKINELNSEKIEDDEKFYLRNKIEKLESLLFENNHNTIKRKKKI